MLLVLVPSLNTELPRKFCYCLMCRVKMERNLTVTEASCRLFCGGPQARPKAGKEKLHGLSFLALHKHLQEEVCEERSCPVFPAKSSQAWTQTWVWVQCESHSLVCILKTKEAPNSEEFEILCFPTCIWFSVRLFQLYIDLKTSWLK